MPINPLDRPWDGDAEIGEILRTNKNAGNRAAYWLIHYALITGDVPPTTNDFLREIAARAGTDTVTVLIQHRAFSTKKPGVGAFAGFADVGRSRRADQN